MIFEALAGLLVALIGAFIFISIKYTKSVSEWILETSKFVYFTGHPLLDDDQKQEIITAKFKNVFKTLSIVIFKTILIILLIIIVVILFSIALLYLREGKVIDFQSPNISQELFPQYLYKAPFIVGSLLPILFIPFLPKILKSSKSNTNEYSPIDKFLHYTFLGNNSLAKTLFKIELSLNKNKLSSSAPVKNVYVSGLARAGTTVLMQYLGQLSEFKSLSYRNLPFLFLPVTWPKFSSKKKVKEKERFHKDGVKHSLNSYEALEEPFWLHYLGNDYIKEKTVKYHNISESVYEKYNSFRKLIAKDKIYLSKNNNHLLRASSLHLLDAENGNITKTIVPFREPYEQAKSLLNQHNTLSKLQEEDEFTLDYMNFLVHHEFGMNAKVSFLEEEDTHHVYDLDKNSIEYWLEIWYIFYKKVYEIYNGEENIYFFCYEIFVKDPHRSLVSLINAIELPVSLVDSISIKEFKPKKAAKSPSTDDKFLELYTKLNLIAINNKK